MGYESFFSVVSYLSSGRRFQPNQPDKPHEPGKPISFFSRFSRLSRAFRMRLFYQINQMNQSAVSPQRPSGLGPVNLRPLIFGKLFLNQRPLGSRISSGRPGRLTDIQGKVIHASQQRPASYASYRWELFNLGHNVPLLFFEAQTRHFAC